MSHVANRNKPDYIQLDTYGMITKNATTILIQTPTRNTPSGDGGPTSS